jgi:putative ABC transport system permease protein
MTKRAIAAIPVDWQVEAVPSADVAAIKQAIGEAARVSALHEVHYADVAGFQANAGKTQQSTGAGKVIAFEDDYAKMFPKELRLLSGAIDGVLIAQQTAANLHVAPGNTVTIERIGVEPATVRIDGVVDLPDADALFQVVGLPPAGDPASAARQCAGDEFERMEPFVWPAASGTSRQYSYPDSCPAGPRCPPAEPNFSLQ